MASPARAASPAPAPPGGQAPAPRPRPRARARKRKRKSLTDSTDEDDECLPESSIEVEKSLQATAVKNNLTDDNVKKILKKVVTNDHVLALVKLREEEGSSTEDESLKPKITRSKAKELTKNSPTPSAPWNLELTPIKHIPVKTRPEVEALIAQELPDESDEEYQLTNDDIMSDDDHTIETCSDVDSQPRTPAMPGSQLPESPAPEALTDGPFKVPGEIKLCGKKRHDSEDEPTIARRTRSKLCLSATTIETIEESFVPPDEPPMLQAEVDDLWSNFLNECLDPAPPVRNEDDDETDPNYNVANDQEAYDEDEETLERSLANVSRKELDDLYNELMFISNNIDKTQTISKGQIGTTSELTTPHKVIDVPIEVSPAQSLQQKDNDSPQRHGRLGTDNMVEVTPRLPIPIKEEPQEESEGEGEVQPPAILKQTIQNQSPSVINIVVAKDKDRVLEEMEVDGLCERAVTPKRPPIFRNFGDYDKPQPQIVTIVMPEDNTLVILPEQMQILEQQLRQHVQLATSNFLQIYAHPKLWSYAPAYKEYLTSLKKISDERPGSVADVCNLRPALELCESWVQTLSEKTSGNEEFVKFMEGEVERCYRRNSQNVLFVGHFHSMFKDVIANSTVFLYPHLLPPVPYRCDQYRRQHYLLSEDRLIALGLQQFWEYLEANKNIYKQRNKFGFALPQVTELLVKHLFPWMTQRTLKYHIQSVRRSGDPDNPIREFFEKKIVRPVRHKLLPYNPNMTLYEQPEYEMPIVWVKHISQHANRAKEFLKRRSRTGIIEPTGLTVEIGNPIRAPIKDPIPDVHRKPTKVTREPGSDIFSFSVPLRLDKKAQTATPVATNNVPAVIQTDNGGYLVPVLVLPQAGTVNGLTIIPSTGIDQNGVNLQVTQNENTVSSTIFHSDDEVELPAMKKHCKCCQLMQDIEERQPRITKYFKPMRPVNPKQPKCCQGKSTTQITRKLKYLLKNFRMLPFSVWRELNGRLISLEFQISTVKTKTLNGVPRSVTELQESTSSRTAGDTDMTELKETLEDLQDQSLACQYMNKLNNRFPFGRCKRKRLHNLFGKFDTASEKPTYLYKEMCKLMGDNNNELAVEFVVFLTAAQADTISMYRDYFIMLHMEPFMKLVREVLPPTQERSVLVGLRAELVKRRVSSCDLCYRMMSLVRTSEKLARYLFDAAPHQYVVLPTKQKKIFTNHNLGKASVDGHKTPSLNEEMPRASENCRDSSSEEMRSDDEYHEEPATDACQNVRDAVDVPIEIINENSPYQIVVSELPNLNASQPIVDTPELTISKTEIADSYYSCSPDTTLTVMSDCEDVKAEPSEWSREEDKIILQAIKEYATPSETKEKTVVQVLEEKKVFKVIKESLTGKHCDDVKMRVDYLLRLLAMDER